MEREAVQAYLTEHNIPDTDAHVIYDYGRADLRSKIRALISSTLLGIIQKAPSLRSPHEKELYNWLQGHVHNNEINLYTQAQKNYVTFRTDPCRFTLDPTLASAYGISYDGKPFCGNTLTSVFGVPAPAKSYFKAYGLKHSYLAPADTYPDYGSLLADMNFNLAAVAGTAAAAGVVITGLAAAGLIASYTAAVSAFTTGLAAALPVTVTAQTSAAFLLSGGTVVANGIAAAVAGPVLIIAIAIVIGVVGGINVFENEANIKELNALSSELVRVTNTPPDLDSFRLDSTGVGLFKLQNTILARTMPDVPSTTPLPAHRDGIDLAFSDEAFAGLPFSYQDWDENIWTARTWGGWIVQTCQKGATSTKACSQADSITADLRYQEPHHADSAGTIEIVNWTASRFGSTFIHTRAVVRPNSLQRPCEADASTGYSSQQDISKCSSYVYPSFRYVSGNGAELFASLVEYTEPVFSSPTYFSFTAGVPSTQTVTVTGHPKSNVFVDDDGGTLTSNSDFTITPGIGTPDFNTLRIAFNGSPTAPAQDYTLNLFTALGFSVVKQTYTISLRPELKITSPGTLNATAGSPLNVLVTTTGSPTPKLSIDPLALVDGLTFTDNGNGTATISGVAPLPGEFTCVKADLSTGTTRPCGIVASNTQGTIEQPFTINLASSPTASVVPPIGATFTAGVENLVLLTSSGATTPVSWSFFPDPSAPWLTLHDNGTGSAVLRGTPPPGTTGTFSPGAVPTALGSRGIAPVYPVTVVNRAVFTSPNTATFTVGSLRSFTVSANTGTIELDNSLPQGLSFAAGNPAIITGVAAAGTGGQYTVTLTDDVAGESATQSLTLNVNEAPQLTSANTATMFVGMPGSFAVTTTGFPSVSNHVIPANAPPPTSPDEGNGTYFTVTGLPAGLTFSNLNPQGFATGTLAIQGTPSAAAMGAHQVKITAENGVGIAAEQMLTLNIVDITGPAPVSGATCNGNYTGTFKGDIMVSAGQNCAFYSGGVSGSVTVIGGNFAANEVNITGNVSIQGAAGFSIGAGTTIAGNLSIQNVASASTTNQICGSRVAGNVTVSANAIPITIGTTGISCLGNSFGANVGITSNTAPIQVYQNDVEKNLSCSNNTSITGGGNLAQKKMSGQCAGF